MGGKDGTMATDLDKTSKEEYLELVRIFPLIHIEDDGCRTAALAVIDRLVEKSDRSVAENAYLAALTDLVETYENAHVALPPATGVEALRYLMEENHLTQADLAPLFGAPSIISEVLSGKRQLALTHARRLAAHFGLPVSVFIDA
jgi:HTH-type transcriptional regulator/antitoxin HigA